MGTLRHRLAGGPLAARATGVLLGASLLFAPWSVWLALTPNLRLPILLITVMLGFLGASLILMLLRQGRLEKIFCGDDLFLFIYIAFLWVSTMLAGDDPKNLSHLAAHVFSILGIYIGLRTAALHLGWSATQFGRWVTAGFEAATCLTILDFALKNSIGFSLRRIFVHPGIQGEFSIDGFHFFDLVWSTSGIAEEPGAMGLIINSLFGVALWFCVATGNGFRLKVNVALYLASTACLLSAGTFAFMAMSGAACAVISVYFLRQHVRPRHLVWLTTLLLALGSLLFVFLSSELGQNLYAFWQAKIMLSGETSSDQLRTGSWELGWKLFVQDPFLGYGAGHSNLVSEVGLSSTFLTVMVEGGAVSALAYVAFFAIQFARVLRYLTPPLLLILFSMGAAVLHSMIGTAFYLVPFWLPFIAAQLILAEREGQPT